MLEMERWGWYPFNLERGKEEMETGRTSLNFIAATLPCSNSLCISQCNIIYLFKLRIYFITVLRLYWPAWIFGHRIERKEKFWQKRYQYFRKKSEEKDFKRHFNMQLKIVNPHSVLLLPAYTQTLRFLAAGTSSYVCFHVVQGRSLC